MNHMADAALNEDRVPVTRMPTDMADLGTDAFEQELTLNLLGNKRGVLEQIEAALNREDGTYGQCEACGKAIPSARLEAIPYTTLCIKCASRQENQGY
jgi:RNA polymerase-binding transcription factor DksA